MTVDGRQSHLVNGTTIVSAMTIATRTITGGWALEAAIPATALGLTTLATGQQFPFTFGLWDNDRFVAPSQTHMLWMSDATDVLKPDWGVLALDGTTYDFSRHPHAYTDSDRHGDCHGNTLAHGHGDCHGNTLAHGHATATPTPTSTQTSTATATTTATTTRTATPSSTPSPTPTASETPPEAPSATPTSTPTQSPTPSTAEISGTVWLDGNGNGVLEAAEPGIGGVQIVLLVQGAPRFSVWTTVDGRYRLTGLTPGSYTVREVQPAEFRFSSTPSEVTLTLAAGETRNVDFGDWNGQPTWLPLVLK